MARLAAMRRALAIPHRQVRHFRCDTHVCLATHHGGNPRADRIVGLPTRSGRATASRCPARLAALDDGGDMLAPCVQRRPLLIGPCVPLVDADDPARLPATWFKTASVTSRRTPSLCSPVAIVRRRSCKRQSLTPLSLSSAALALLNPLNAPALAGKHKLRPCPVGGGRSRVNSGRGPQDRLRLRRQRHDMGDAVLCAGWPGWSMSRGPARSRPKSCAVDFLAPLAGQHQHPHDRVERSGRRSSPARPRATPRRSARARASRRAQAEGLGTGSRRASRA